MRAEGGISRLWAEMAGSHVELREIDYAEVLRERDAGARADWDQVIARCLEGDAQLDLERRRAGAGSSRPPATRRVSPT